jgi:hypothetical protein
MTVGIILRSPDGRFAPKGRVEGSVSWDLESAPAWLEVRLTWHTEGKGTDEVMVVGRLPLTDVRVGNQRTFSFTLPEMPYTYHGRIFSILWSIDVFGPAQGILRRNGRLATLPIVVSPTLQPFGDRRE